MLGFIILAILAVVVGVVLFSPWLKGWRTQIFGYATVLWGAAVPLAGELIEYLQALDWRQYLLSADKKNLYVLAIVGGLGLTAIILRHLTTGPVGTK